jgi:ATP-dependent Clp protease protease subunit
MSSDDGNDIIVNKFTEESAKNFRSKVLKQSSLDPNMPIVVYIDSYGGYVDACNSMLETLHQVPNSIITVCIGKAMSCGAVLLAAGDYRYCGRHSRVMIHEVSGGAIGNIDDIKNSVDETDRLNLQLMSFIADRCNMSYKQLKQILKDNDGRELYLTAEQAKEFGIVDFIGTPSIQPIIAYEVESVPEREYEISSGEYKKYDLVKHAEVKKNKKKVSKKKVVKKKKKTAKKKVVKKKKKTAKKKVSKKR